MTRLHWLYWPLIGVGAVFVLLGLVRLLYRAGEVVLAVFGFSRWVLRKDEPLDEEW